MGPMDSKAQSKSVVLPNDLNFYEYLSEFLVKNGKVEDISGMVDVVIESLPRILPISYVSIFLHRNSSKLILEGESEVRLKKLGITELVYDHLTAIQKWPSLLSELSGTDIHKSHLNKFKQILCFPIRVEDKIEGLICFELKFNYLSEKTKIGLNLAIVQIGLTLERLDRLIKDFEKFAHKREFILEKWDINLVIRQTATIIKKDFLRVGKADFDLRLQSLPCYIKMDRNLMGATLTHLLLNAAEATGKEGLVTISTYSKNDQIVVEIQDNGKGIPLEILDQIFNPFFSTKAGGTGLGLTHVQQIINEHHGEIVVSSRINEGTTFIITFPKA